MSATKCEIVTNFDRLQSFASDWDRLAASGGTVFQSWSWSAACATNSECELHTPVVTCDGRVIGILPLVRDGRMLKSLGSPYSDSNDLMFEPDRAIDVLTACCDALLHSDVKWKTCVLENVPESSPFLTSRDLVDRQFASHLSIVRRFVSSLVRDDGTGVFDHLSRKRSFRQHENQLSRCGKKLVFRHLEDRSEIHRRLDDFFDMHATRSALAGRRSQFTENHSKRIIRAMVDRFDSCSDLRFSILELDGRPVAYNLGFQSQDRFVCYVPTFDVDFWDYAPGEVIFRNLFKYADQVHLKYFDLTIGDESYKSRFATDVSQTYTVHFDRQPHSAGVVAARAQRKVENRLRQRPKALAAMRRGAAIKRAFFDDARTGFTSLRRSLISYLMRACKQTTLDVSLPNVLHTPDSVVTRLELRDFGRHLAQKQINIDPRKLLEVRENFKRDAELYRISVNDSEFLLWVMGNRFWEDSLTASSCTNDFGKAIAGLLLACKGEVLRITTGRLGAERAIRNAGLSFTKPGIDRDEMKPVINDSVLSAANYVRKAL
jgi:CelD/BcsL family acetyltransferase involved in cellulose biosynthesis